MENSTTEGLPEDELFVYEDALRQGHSAVIALAANTSKPKPLAARWKLLARKASIALATCGGSASATPRKKPTRRTAAISPRMNATSLWFRRRPSTRQSRQILRGVSRPPRDRYPGAHEREPFQRGFQRGRAYFEALRNRATSAPR